MLKESYKNRFVLKRGCNPYVTVLHTMQILSQIGGVLVLSRLGWTCLFDLADVGTFIQ